MESASEVFDGQKLKLKVYTFRGSKTFLSILPPAALQITLRVNSLKKSMCSTSSKSCPIRVDPILERLRPQFKQTESLENCLPLKTWQKKKKKKKKKESVRIHLQLLGANTIFNACKLTRTLLLQLHKYVGAWFPERLLTYLRDIIVKHIKAPGKSCRSIEEDSLNEMKLLFCPRQARSKIVRCQLFISYLSYAITCPLL